MKALNLLDASKDEPRREFTVDFKDLFSPCGANGASGTTCASFSSCRHLLLHRELVVLSSVQLAGIQQTSGVAMAASSVRPDVAFRQQWWRLGIDVAPSTPQCYDRECSRELGETRRAAKRERRAQVREAPLSQRA